MIRIPDSPEGVALALLMLIEGIADMAVPPRRPMDEAATLLRYRRCLAAVQDAGPIPTIQDILGAPRQH